MKFNFTLICLCLLFLNAVYTQDSDVASSIFKVNFLSPGISYEVKTGNSKTLYFQTYLSSAAIIDADADDVSWFFDPALLTQFRYYYNGEKRAAKGKRTAMNSMNYIAPSMEFLYSKFPVGTTVEENNRRPVYNAGLVWGLQRNYDNRFSVDFAIGPGYRFSTSEATGAGGETSTNRRSEFALLAHLNLGFWLNKK